MHIYTTIEQFYNFSSGQILLHVLTICMYVFSYENVYYFSSGQKLLYILYIYTYIFSFSCVLFVKTYIHASMFQVCFGLASKIILYILFLQCFTTEIGNVTTVWLMHFSLLGFSIYKTLFICTKIYLEIYLMKKKL